VATETQVDAGS